jgi:hypothetical protein
MVRNKLDAIRHAATHAAFEPNAIPAIDPLRAAHHLDGFE